MEKYTITIARGYGSGGKTIGKMLAESLNIPCYNKDILQKASDESGINHALFAQADEKSAKGWHRFFKKKKYTGNLIPPSSDNFVSEENLFNYQSKIIKDLAAKESCVFIGRCADYILKDQENVFRIYVNAPFDTCIKNVIDKDGVDEAEAKKRIRAIDKRRSAYYTYYTGQNWQDASNYDLCINSKDFTFEECSELIKKALEIRFNCTLATK